METHHFWSRSVSTVWILHLKSIRYIFKLSSSILLGMFGCMRIVAILGIAAIRNSSVIQTMHSLFGIAENSANPLFLQKLGIATNPKCEEREKVFISWISTNTVPIWQSWHHFCHLHVMTIRLRPHLSIFSLN